MNEGERKHDHSSSCWCCGRNTKSRALGWGVFLIILGGYFLAQELGYISYSVSVWPVVLLGLGLYLVAKSLGNK